MTDAVVICTQVPFRFQEKLRTKFSWKVHLNRKKETVYTIDNKSKHIRYKYCPSHARLFCRFNAPAIIHGHNGALLNADDWPVVVEAVYSDLLETFSWKPLDLNDWVVSSIEYPFHLKIDPSEKGQWLQELARLRIPYFLANTEYTNKGTTYQKNTCRQLIVYDKSEQLKKDGLVLPELHDVLRLEMRFKNTRALKLQMNKWCGGLTAATLHEATSLEWVKHIRDDIQGLVGEIVSAPTPDEARSVMMLHGWSKAKTEHHLQWMASVTEKGAASVFVLNKNTFYRRRKNLDKVGLPTMFSCGLSNPEWVEPKRSVTLSRTA